MSGSFIIQPRHRWMIQRISEGFGVSEASVEQSVRNSDNSKLFKHFLGANGPSRIFAFNQPPMRQSDENPGEWVQETDVEQIFLTTGDEQPIQGKAVYFVRMDENNANAIDVNVISMLICKVILCQCYIITTHYWNN